ncbi:MAG: tRNA pseudouridine(38-40) synthase TruA [Methylacidiphilales bacterium]|nr:tRNA pseudouridine(38-40) synthase TruA [Candidatus Methylacidiphilales bacterium]MDW8349994.1 tRNA pseudouridine(38-40) synthase TruA [Verrucomicrobiae bacterium]
MLSTYILTLSYKGTRYQGWQRQANTPHTIQQILENALSTLFSTPITTDASGRTDAGVHALGQIVAFRAPRKFSPATLLRALNAHLPPDIRVLRARHTPTPFHPRFDAHSKTYLYKIYNHPIHDPFLVELAWHQPLPLSLPAMRQAARHLIGRHDFSAFFTNPGYPVPDRTRTLYRLTISQPAPHHIEIRATADGFLHRMMRNLVGTLVAVGRQKLSPQQIPLLLESKSRLHAPATAPAHGLYLEKVHYRKPSTPHQSKTSPSPQ